MPFLSSARAAVRPPIPAPAIRMRNRRYLIAATPAWEMTSSCDPVPPDTPIAPMILPFTTLGLPPRDPIMPSSVAREPKNGPLPSSRSKLTVGRRNVAAAFALCCEMPVLMRLHARDADCADAGALHHDRQATLHRRHARHAQELGPLGDALLPVGGRAPGFGSGASLLYGDARIRRRGAVHPDEVQQMPTVIQDRDADVPVVLSRFLLGGGGDLLAVVEGEHRSGLHCSASLLGSVLERREHTLARLLP